MKKILIVHTNMELGGAETSLLGLLHSIDYHKNSVDLLLYEKKGDLLPYIPKEVNCLSVEKEYLGLVLPIKEVLLKQHLIGITFARLMGKIKGRNKADKTYATKQYAHHYAMPFLPNIPGEYDLAISFIDPHFVVAHKVHAKVKAGWIHTDFSRIQVDRKIDFAMWNALDYIVNVSDVCKEKFDKKYPELRRKSIVIENILSRSFIERQSRNNAESHDMHSPNRIKILSIGRYCDAKNFDNVPDICKQILNSGLNVTWYIIGYGGDEPLIRQKIAESHMEDHVILLGKKENPYPYIRACDLYVQPSRYEGKSVTVREAQMLGKPVVITKYATSASQLEDGMDGVIVPMDNEGCANGIAELLRDPQRMELLRQNCGERDYSNRGEVEKLYQLMEG